MKQSEEEFAKHVAAWLSRSGWDCYFEVPLRTGRADIVATRGSVLWIVECKLHANLDLVNQCMDRLRVPCNGVLGVAPKSPSRAVRSVAELLGFGLAGCDAYHGQFYAFPPLRRINAAATRALLKPQMKLNSPGTNGAHWTPFKELVRELEIDLHEAPLRELQGLDCLKRYKHRAPAASRRALADYLDKGLIPGWRLEKRSDGLLWAVRTERGAKT